jgi:hypothetical protein
MNWLLLSSSLSWQCCHEQHSVMKYGTLPSQAPSSEPGERPQLRIIDAIAVIFIDAIAVIFKDEKARRGVEY